MLFSLPSIAPIRFSSFSLFILFYFDVAITHLPRGPYSRFRRIFSIPIVVFQSFNDLSSILQQFLSIFLPFVLVIPIADATRRSQDHQDSPSSRMTFESPRKSLWKSLPHIIPDKTPMITSSTKSGERDRRSSAGRSSDPIAVVPEEILRAALRRQFSAVKLWKPVSKTLERTLSSDG